ncbi:MAG: tRNA (adenosine(37)-N6)-threonylcarbamoyltransferase complex dimerization subunit type 1 TsaB [Dehalococcoidia bacterium]
MSTVLALDTASQRFALALALNTEVVDALVCDEPQSHTRLLVPSIDRILGDRKRDLTAIVVVQGPGSYAGLRVGLATAAALTMATGALQTGVTVFEALAAAGAPSGPWTAIHPLGREQFAAQPFEGSTPVGEPRSSQATALAGLLRGEGAGALGGVEVGPEARVLGALHAGLAGLQANRTTAPGAFYLSEPRITQAKRTPLVAITGGS